MKFIVFDMDGVLVDTTPCHERAFRDLWQRYGVDGPPYSAIAGRPTREVVEHYTNDVTEWVEFKQQKAREYIRTGVVVFEDVRPCLKALERGGIRMGVATGASRETAALLLGDVALAGFFQFVLAAEDVSRGKPHPEVYRKAIDLAGADAGQTIVAEDSAAGLESAAAASVPVACVRTGLRLQSPFFFGSYPGLVDFTRALGVEV